MLSLKDLQATFQRHIFTGDGDIVEHIVGMENASNEQRVATYTNAYYGRLVEALRGDYPACHALLGDDDFTALCHDYIRVYPSTHYSLRWFGRYLPDFICGHALATGRGYLNELSNLEWTFIHAFDSTDAEVLDETAVTTLPTEVWPEITIRFHPSVRYLDYHWNILDLWRAVRDKDTIPAPQALPDTSCCLIWRQALTTRYRTLDADEAAALKAATKGASFAQLCELLMSLTPYSDHQADDYEVNIALRGAGLLKTWITEGLIVQLN